MAGHDTTGRVQVSTYFRNPRIVELMKEYAEQETRNMSYVLIEACREYLVNHGVVDSVDEIPHVAKK